MHITLKNYVLLAAVAATLTVFVGCGGKKTSIKTPPIPKSALELNCEARSTPREKAICYEAQSQELAEKAKQAAKAARQSEPKSVRKVEHQMEEKAEQEKKAIHRQNQAYANAKITGCAPGVWVNPAVAFPSRWLVMSTVEVVNLGALQIDEIRAGAGYGPVVRSLCSGGSLSLYFVQKFTDPDTLQIPLKAISRLPDGGVATADFWLYLNRYSAQFNRVQAQVWQVRLSRAYQLR